jgi:AcrR family transcriptional regulator
MVKADRREQIVASAAAVFADRGYHDAAISDIIDRAGIARGTFYLYFTSKRAVFDDILERTFERILAQLEPVDIRAPIDRADVLRQLSDNARRLAHLVTQERDCFRVLLAEAGGLDEPVRTKLTLFYQRLAQWIARSLDKGIRVGIVRPCETDLAAQGLLGMFRGIFLSWVSGVLPEDEEAFVDEVLQWFTSGLLVTLAPSAKPCRYAAPACRRRPAG